MLTSDNLALPSEAEAEEWRALELLAVLEQLEIRGLLTTEVNDVGELRITPTAAGIAAVKDYEAS